jgi:hypothetical protein
LLKLIFGDDSGDYEISIILEADWLMASGEQVSGSKKDAQKVIRKMRRLKA